MLSAPGRKVTDYLIEEARTLLAEATCPRDPDVRALAVAVSEHFQRLASGRACEPSCPVCERIKPLDDPRATSRSSGRFR